jgi:putative hydrolase of the HAD superfamily
LDQAGIPYGAVSNNVHDYQRVKLDSAGLERIRFLVGTDTVGVPKPDPAIYLEGVRLIGSTPASTLYIGDNRLLDAEGSTAAGLSGIWLNRTGEQAPGFQGREIASLLELLALPAGSS